MNTDKKDNVQETTTIEQDKVENTFLCERTLTSSEEGLFEAKVETDEKTGKKDYYLVGRIMTADEKNENGRVYPKKEIEAAVKYFKERAEKNLPVYGELDHPADGRLGIELKNVSHMIVDAWMDKNYGMGKFKIIGSPAGNIAKAIIDAGGYIGVSTRGTGSVDSRGYVYGFDCRTVDLVADPSGPGCIPQAIMESAGDKFVSIEENSINTIRQDSQAQELFANSIIDFIEKLSTK